MSHGHPRQAVRGAALWGAVAAAIVLLCGSCRSPSTPELWESILEPGISREERLRRETRLVRRLEKERRAAGRPAGTDSGADSVPPGKAP